MSRYRESGFGKRTLDNDEHWIPLNVEEYRINGPTIICLGGNGTVDSAKAKRFCGSVERMLNLKAYDGSYRNYRYVDLVGFHYGMDSELNDEGKPSDTGYFTKEYRDKIVDNMFLPLCIDKGLNKNYSLGEICKNWSQVIIFTHCHGAKELGQMMADLNYKLYKRGFTQDQINMFMGFAFHISYSPFTDENWIPCVRVQSFTDSINLGLDRLYKSAYEDDLDGISIKLDKAGEIRGQKYFASHQKVISVYAKQLLNNPELVGVARAVASGKTDGIDEEKLSWIRNLKLRNQALLDSKGDITFDEHSFECLERNTDWSIANGSKCADAVSQIFAKSFEIAFENSTYNANKAFYGQYVPRMSMERVYEKLNDDILGMFNPKDLKALPSHSQDGPVR